MAFSLWCSCMPCKSPPGDDSETVSDSRLSLVHTEVLPLREPDNPTIERVGEAVRKKNRCQTAGDLPKKLREMQEEEDGAATAKRNKKRAQTLPPMRRLRGRDYRLSDRNMVALEEVQVEMKKQRSCKLGDDALLYISQEALESCWQRHTTCFLHGTMTEGQTPGDDREVKMHGASSLPDKPLPSPMFSCRKGCKGEGDTSPNQDNFSITYFKNGWAMVCVMDGHGQFGHLVSTQTVQTVPYYMAQESFDEDELAASLTKSFESAQEDIVAMAMAQSWNVQASGSTAVAALWKGKKVFIANCGDSRCIIGNESNKLLFATEDHKPSVLSEKKRVEASGGEVRTEVFSDGWTDHRMFIKDEDYPGLGMTRTLGDDMVKQHGVVATPEVFSFEVNPAEKPYMILASDGIWEFLDSETVVKAATSSFKGRGAKQTLEDLHDAAAQCWREEDAEYCDDITAVMIQLA